MKKVFCVLVIFVFCLSTTGWANEYFGNIELELPYEYNFDQQFIVAGERVLNINIKNNTDHNVQAIELEIRLMNAFREDISDWTT